MRKLAILIAIEHYADTQIPRIDYAQADAKGLSAAFQGLGFDPAEQIMLVDTQATKTTIESRVRRALAGLGDDDSLYFYCAGHRFVHDAKNHLVCHDTSLDDLEPTSVSFHWLLTQFERSACKNIVLFLDASVSVMWAGVTARGAPSDLTDRELKDFFEKGEHRVCFTASRPDESSHRSGNLKHGIWAFHLMEALRANAPLALVDGQLITSASLQNHLSQEVPRTIRKTFTPTAAQTPGAYGTLNDELLIGNVAAILAARTAQANPAAIHLPHVSFRGEVSIPVKQLGGFKQFHAVPKKADAYSQDFVGKIGAADVEAELDAAYSRIRDAMGYKRRDLNKSYDGGRAGTIITPDFDYNITLAQDEEDPSHALMRREIGHIQNPEVILSEGFQNTFASAFDTIEFTASKGIDVQAFIDRVEDTEPKGVHLVDYDDEGTFCTLRLDGVKAMTTITAHSVRVVSPVPAPPRALAQLFSDTWNALLPTAPKGMLSAP